MTKKNVAIIYDHVAHYRKPIFDTLCKDTDINYYIAADEKSNTVSLKVLNASNTSSGPNISRRWINLRNIWLTNHILWQRGVVELSLRKKYSHLVFLGNMYYISTWVSAILAKLNGKKVYFWTHGFRSNKKNIKETIRYIFYNLADGIFLYGNHAKTILIDKGYPAHKLHVIYNSLNYEEQKYFLNKTTESEIVKKKSQLEINLSNKVIITSSRLTKDKNIKLLIKALSIINSGDAVKHNLIIIGDGPETDSLIKYSADLLVDKHVVFYGSCYDEKELSLLISMSDVFVVPGDIGLSAIHALSYGTPVVTHNNFNTQKPEFEAIKNNLNGSFFKLNNTDDLVAKILLWTTQAHSNTFNQCTSVISSFYNPAYQHKIINDVINIS